jgi:hypothetical protein
MFKNMDNSFIKSMMQMQGINMTDDQLNLMKNNMNPDMMKMAANTQSNNIPSFPGNGNMPSFPNNNTNSSNSNSENLNREPSPTQENQANQNSNNITNTNNTPSPAGFPDMGNMDMGKMMEMIQNNPQMMNMMGPQMSQMFGNGANGAPNMDPNLMMSSMQTILWIMGIPSRIKQFFSSTRGKLLILLIVVLIGSYFYR